MAEWCDCTLELLKLIRPHFLPFNPRCFHEGRPQSYLQLQKYHPLSIGYTSTILLVKVMDGALEDKIKPIMKHLRRHSEVSAETFEARRISNKTCRWGNSDRWASTTVWSVMSWDTSRLPVDQSSMMKYDRFFLSEHYWNHLEQYEKTPWPKILQRLSCLSIFSWEIKEFDSNQEFIELFTN